MADRAVKPDSQETGASTSGGGRAGRELGGSLGSPRWPRILRMTSPASIVAITDMRPPQREGHQALEGTAFASNAREPSAEHAAGQELSELARRTAADRPHRCARRSRRERSRSARAPPDGGRCPPWPGAGSWRRPHTAPPARGMPPRLGGEAPDLSRVGRHGWQRQRATTRCAHGQPAPAFTRRGGARTRYSDDAARRRSGSAGSTLAAGRAVSKPPTRSRTHRTRAGSHRPRSSNSE